MPVDDELPIFRPRKRGSAVRDAQDSSFRRAVLSNVKSAARRGYARARKVARARVAVRPPRRFDRRVAVKARYVQGDFGKSARLHLAYVVREGVEQDGSPGRLYSAQGQSVEIERALLEPLNGEQHQFRVIISPEDGGELDLTAYTRSLLSRIERDLGQRLIWGAVNHHDTDNPHVHLIVRGVDRDGFEVRFDRAYISQGLRHRAQELATEELGPRREQDFQRQLRCETRQGRLTSLDRKIGRRVEHGVVKAKDLNQYQRERMRVLEQMGLAERAGRDRWRVVDGWQEHLRLDGQRGDIIKQMHRRVEDGSGALPCCPPFRALPTVATESPGVLHGRVVRKGLNDRSSDGMYAVIETARGSAYYVPLWRSELDTVREGDLITLRQQRDSWCKLIFSGGFGLIQSGRCRRSTWQCALGAAGGGIVSHGTATTAKRRATRRPSPDHTPREPMKRTDRYADG